MPDDNKPSEEKTVDAPEPDFKTPDEAAATDDATETTDPTPAADGVVTSSATKTGWRQKLELHWPPGRKEYIVVAVAVVILIVLGFLIFGHHGKKVVKAAVHKPVTKVVAPKTVPSALTGLPVDPAVNARPVTGVMIENSIDARPQSGLSQAGVVFEAIAEGGITRFLTLFQDTAPDDIGPIRSARPYYVQWALGFDAGYAHVGGSPEALADIKTWGVHDLDQFANGGSYHRINSREAPHNVYTAVSTLNELEAAKGQTGSKFTGFPRKKAAPTKMPPTAKTIDFRLSGPLYNVHYDYTASTNSYNRSEGGAPHLDANGNALISPKVVVALVTPYGIASDGHHSDYGTIGSGAAYVYQDGVVTVGQWTKGSDAAQITFTDAAGKPLTFNPGQTWLTAVGSADDITSAP